MESKDIITKALNYYLIYIQMGDHDDAERRKSAAIECISYINDGGKIDKNWLISKNLFFVDVFNEYSSFLKREMQNAIPNEEEIEKLQMEKNTINTFIEST